MASVTIQYPDSEQARVIEALCIDGGWTPELGVTKGAFAKQQVARLVRERVREVETAQARHNALASVVPPAEVNVS